MCGICLSGSARSIRAGIDGCGHQFCFVCIMEWAKIETRCPLCKRRFGAVRRPAAAGLFEEERIVRICERNQVYNPYGIESTAINEPTNPNTNCTICNSRENESFLLLCNLCNSASHTFCTGLGWTVPDSNWYCADCTICKTEQERYQPETLENIPSGQETLEKIRAVRNGDSSADLNIYDFVPGTEELVPIAELAPNSNNNLNNNNSKRLQNRINFIRANWDLMRAGDLEFNAGFVNPNSGERKGKSLVESSRNRDVSKSWKMLSKAKPVINKKKPVENNSVVNSRPQNSNRGIRIPVFRKTGNSYNGISSDKSRKDSSSFGNGNVCNTKSVLMIKNQEQAKSKIQSLVKDNLKIYKLGTDRFKEVARVSTHLILAACGFNHSPLAARNFPKLLCYHNNVIRSNLMPNSCKECFYSFVYEVVKSVISE
ncbi:hypothetical protein LUZ60_000149 [Juncus effusus]|nr:hypothetical protein LUZ60_000149 [Juncus effusus]